MMDSIKAHKDSADWYDRAARDTDWHGHELIYGMCCEYMMNGGKLLDVGIGTGLSSELFAESGIDVTGIDGSPEMLKVCAAKPLACKLILHDLTATPWPVESREFYFVISIGLFHFFEDLKPFIEEISRIIKPNGIFAFTVADFGNGSGKPAKRLMEGVAVYSHPPELVLALLNECGFVKLKSAGILTRISLDKPDEMLHRAFVVRKAQP